MPLALRPKSKKMSVKKFSNAIKRAVVVIDEKVVFLIFLLIATILSLLRIDAWLFFVCFAVYTVMYFAERIVKIYKRQKT